MEGHDRGEVVLIFQKRELIIPLLKLHTNNVYICAITVGQTLYQSL